MSGDRTGLDRLLGTPATGWLVARVRSRIPAADGPLAGVVRLAEPTEEQRQAVRRLVGPPRRAGAGLSVDLAMVEEVLRRGPWPAGLADAVETLTGPVVDRRAERERDAAAWERAGAGLRGVARPGFAEWWERWRAAGNLKRAARAEAERSGAAPGPAVAGGLVDTVAAVLAELPASGEPLAVLARRATGDAHGLDPSRPLGRLAVAVVGACFSPEAGELSTRDAWAAAGVVLSNVASTVLSLGVPGMTGAGSAAGRATAAALEAMRAARTPLVLTLDQVRSGGVAPLPADAVIHACENPTVVEVVAARWADSPCPAERPVLVCTWGQPSTAVVELLQVLTSDGAGCRYHGDLDWAGLRIATALRAKVGWEPWHYSAADYRSAVAAEPRSRALTGAQAESSWDPELAQLMAATGLAIEEEAVAEELAADLLGGGTRA